MRCARGGGDEERQQRQPQLRDQLEDDEERQQRQPELRDQLEVLVAARGDDNNAYHLGVEKQIFQHTGNATMQRKQIRALLAFSTFDTNSGQGGEETQNAHGVKRKERAEKRGHNEAMNAIEIITSAAHPCPVSVAILDEMQRNPPASDDQVVPHARHVKLQAGLPVAENPIFVKEYNIVPHKETLAAISRLFARETSAATAAARMITSAKERVFGLGGMWAPRENGNTGAIDTSKPLLPWLRRARNERLGAQTKSVPGCAAAVDESIQATIIDAATGGLTTHAAVALRELHLTVAVPMRAMPATIAIAYYYFFGRAMPGALQRSRRRIDAKLEQIARAEEQSDREMFATLVSRGAAGSRLHGIDGTAPSGSGVVYYWLCFAQSDDTFWNGDVVHDMQICCIGSNGLPQRHNGCHMVAHTKGASTNTSLNNAALTAKGIPHNRVLGMCVDNANDAMREARDTIRQSAHLNIFGVRGSTQLVVPDHFHCLMLVCGAVTCTAFGKKPRAPAEGQARVVHHEETLHNLWWAFKHCGRAASALAEEIAGVMNTLDLSVPANATKIPKRARAQRWATTAAACAALLGWLGLPQVQTCEEHWAAFKTSAREWGAVLARIGENAPATTDCDRTFGVKLLNQMAHVCKPGTKLKEIFSHCARTVEACPEQIVAMQTEADMGHFLMNPGMVWSRMVGQRRGRARGFRLRELVAYLLEVEIPRVKQLRDDWKKCLKHTAVLVESVPCATMRSDLDTKISAGCERAYAQATGLYDFISHGGFPILLLNDPFTCRPAAAALLHAVHAELETVAPDLAKEHSVLPACGRTRKYFQLMRNANSEMCTCGCGHGRLVHAMRQFGIFFNNDFAKKTGALFEIHTMSEDGYGHGANTEQPSGTNADEQSHKQGDAFARAYPIMDKLLLHSVEACPHTSVHCEIKHRITAKYQALQFWTSSKLNDMSAHQSKSFDARKKIRAAGGCSDALLETDANRAALAEHMAQSTKRLEQLMANSTVPSVKAMETGEENKKKYGKKNKEMQIGQDALATLREQNKSRLAKQTAGQYRAVNLAAGLEATTNSAGITDCLKNASALHTPGGKEQHCVRLMLSPQYWKQQWDKNTITKEITLITGLEEYVKKKSGKRQKISVPAVKAMKSQLAALNVNTKGMKKTDLVQHMQRHRLVPKRGALVLPNVKDIKHHASIFVSSRRRRHNVPHWCNSRAARELEQSLRAAAPSNNLARLFGATTPPRAPPPGTRMLALADLQLTKLPTAGGGDCAIHATAGTLTRGAVQVARRDVTRLRVEVGDKLLSWVANNGTGRHPLYTQPEPYAEYAQNFRDTPPGELEAKDWAENAALSVLASKLERTIIRIDLDLAGHAHAGSVFHHGAPTVMEIGAENLATTIATNPGARLVVWQNFHFSRAERAAVGGRESGARTPPPACIAALSGRGAGGNVQCLGNPGNGNCVIHALFGRPKIPGCTCVASGRKIASVRSAVAQYLRKRGGHPLYCGSAPFSDHCDYIEWAGAPFDDAAISACATLSGASILRVDRDVVAGGLPLRTVYLAHDPRREIVQQDIASTLLFAGAKLLVVAGGHAERGVVVD